VAERQSVGLALGQAELLREPPRVPLVQRVTVGEEEKEGDTDVLSVEELVVVWLGDLDSVPVAQSVRVAEGVAVEKREAL
jgi:hypothetical protein